MENHRANLVVTLLRGSDAVDNATVDTSGGFTFTDVSAGAYTLRLEGVTQPVQVTAGQTAQAAITLPPRNSVIEGTVTNGAGLLLRLVSQGDVLAQGALGQSGTFRLRNLAAATYFVQVVRPGEIDPVVQSEALMLDGNNQRRIDLTVPQEQPTPDGVIKQYVLLGAADKATTKAHLTQLAPVLADQRMTFGFDVHEAANAREVIVIGDGHAVAEGALIYLSMRGVKIKRLTGAPEAIRAQLEAGS
ncbi:MAG: carboxypeptidase-like regulatory domain-containing protein [Caldilineaceae bacterium]